MIYENERCDEVNDRLKLIQKTDGLAFGTDALLLAGYIFGRFKRAAELGSGSGIISMLSLTRDKASSLVAFEVQEEYARLSERNAELNSLSDRMSVICCDVRDIKYCEEYDLVFTNPPYMKKTSGLQNEKDSKNIARHEICGTIGDFTEAAKKLLKFGGSFYAVYRPDRLTDILFEMRKSTLEPKRLTFVHANKNSEASMVLIEAKKGGKGGMILTKPLIIYKDENNKEYGEDTEYIMKYGSFPPEYKR